MSGLAYSLLTSIEVLMLTQSSEITATIGPLEGAPLSFNTPQGAPCDRS